MDQQKFEEACDKIIGVQREREGIGTLGEKTVHAVVKNYLEPREAYQEIKIDGFYADICNEEGIIEVQTRNFNTLRKKLQVFLPAHKVTIVYPIPYTKWLCWIDEETGEVSKRRKSPKQGSIYMIFRELYRIREFLNDPNLQLHMILMDMEEYRLLNGWSRDKKKGSTRFDRIPVALVDEYRITESIDYSLFIPDSLNESFTSKDYQKAIQMSAKHASTGLLLLNEVAAVERVGKEGRMYVYKRKQ